MTFWRRAPREVYRVYGEDEYLAGENDAIEDSDPTSETNRHQDRRAIVSPRSHGSHTARLVGIGLLIGVTVGALGIVILNISSRASRPSSIAASRGVRTEVAHSLTSHGSASFRPQVGSRPSAAASVGSERATRRSAGAAVSHMSATHLCSGSAAHSHASRSLAALCDHLAKPKQLTSLAATNAGELRQAEASVSRDVVPPALSQDGEFEFER